MVNVNQEEQGRHPKLEGTFNNLIDIIFLVSSAKFGSFYLEAEKEKYEGYLMVVICDVIKGFWPN